MSCLRATLFLNKDLNSLKVKYTKSRSKKRKERYKEKSSVGSGARPGGTPVSASRTPPDNLKSVTKDNSPLQLELKSDQLKDKLLVPSSSKFGTFSFSIIFFITSRPFLRVEV